MTKYTISPYKYNTGHGTSYTRYRILVNGKRTTIRTFSSKKSANKEARKQNAR